MDSEEAMRGARVLANDLDRQITAWAFAWGVDGAIRNEIMRQVRAVLLAQTTGERGGVTQVMEWLPIETAPKDRTRVLLWDGGDVFTGFWLGGKWQDECDFAFSSEGRDWAVRENVTHWMPLPDPPKDAL